MAYQRLLNPRTIMVFMLAGLLAIAVSCGGAADPTAESGAQAPTVAATVQPAATPAPAATTAPASTAATPVARAQPPTPGFTCNDGRTTRGNPERGLQGTGAFRHKPQTDPGSGHAFVGSTVGEQLLYRDVEGNYLPKLVEEWSVSDDNLVWTMKLQEGVQFHHGYGEMTADDVIWTMQKLRGGG